MYINIKKICCEIRFYGIYYKYKIFYWKYIAVYQKYNKLTKILINLLFLLFILYFVIYKSAFVIFGIISICMDFFLNFISLPELIIYIQLF